MSGDVGAEVAAVLVEAKLRRHYGDALERVEADLPAAVAAYREMYLREAREDADALAPLIAQRVEAAKAEGWDEAVRTIVDAGLINSTTLAYGGAPSNPYR